MRAQIEIKTIILLFEHRHLKGGDCWDMENRRNEKLPEFRYYMGTVTWYDKYKTGENPRRYEF